MAEEEEDNKTEQPSARKLQKAYDEGQLPLSRDLAGVVGLAFGVIALMGAMTGLRDHLLQLVAESAREVHRTPFATLKAMALWPALFALLVTAAAALGGTAALLAQTKGGFWSHLALPDLTRVFQPQRVTRLVSKEMLVDLGLSAVKVLAVFLVLWLALRDEFLTLGKLVFATPGAQLGAVFRPLSDSAVKVLAAMALLAGVDLAVNRHRFMKKNMMTKEEAKREYKEDEGDPMLRGRRKRKHRELAKGRVQTEVPRADALVVNPTHIAIAIRYRKDEGAAPRVLAKGKGQLAEVMRELARANGVPIVQDIPLARLLYKKVKVGKSVPAETYKAVAAVLAFVYRLSGRSSSAGASR